MKPSKPCWRSSLMTRCRLVIPLAEETFDEGRHSALDVAEVHVGDFVSRGQVPDGLKDRFFSTHLRDGPQAKFDAETRARGELDATLERRHRAKDTRDAPERGHRGVIGVQGQPGPACSAMGTRALTKYS